MEKIELTDKDRRELETLAAILNQAQIADYLGFSERTLRNIFDRDAEALAAYKRGRAKAIFRVGNGLLEKAVKGDTPSAIFYMKTQAGWSETQEFHIKPIEPFTGLHLTRAQPDQADAD